MTTRARPAISRTDVRLLLLAVILAAGWWLGYTHLQSIADWLTYDVLGLSPETPLGESLNFFIYDVPKLLLLLAGMIFVITLAQTFVTPEQVKRLIGARREGVGNVFAALFGAVTPFCSCSSVPLFIGFVEAGVPLGITFSFLITSPIVNEVALVLLLGMFGWQIALLYLASGLLIGIVAGIVMGHWKMERYVEDFVHKVRVRAAAASAERLSWRDRIAQSADKTREIVGKVWLFVIIGIGVGAFIHGYVPQDALASIMGEEAWWSVPAAVVLGIPLYSNAAGIIAIAGVLLDKGAAIGTVLAFMMSVVALSVPELIILRRVLKPRLIAVFVAVVAVGIVFTGLLFNLVI